MKTILSQLLVDVKLADARCRRSKSLMQSMNKDYEQMTDSVVCLYTFLRSKSISEIERLCK